MHYLIGFITAVMVLFPASDSGGKSLYQLWMESYEKYLYQQMYDNFERERNEQAASEETQAETEAVKEVHTDTQIVDTPTVVTTPLYKVDGYIPDEGLQTYLYTRLREANIAYFMPYAVCLIAQESTWNPMAENRNGLDKGLLQYRISYWPTLEWWNPYAEIDVFVQQMANRANNGKTVSEMISAHNQSDWGPYCQSYVDAVMQHSNTLVQIR